MPAPESITVDLGSPAPSRRVVGGAVRNLDSAAIAPEIVLAFRGMILGGGNSPVYGILIKGFGIEKRALALKRRGSGRWNI
jgi:hypothetical protein